jgi:hypothetical protein
MSQSILATVKSCFNTVDNCQQQTTKKMKTILKSFETLVICITRPETALLRVRVRFVGRGDSRGLNASTKFYQIAAGGTKNCSFLLLVSEMQTIFKS